MDSNDDIVVNALAYLHVSYTTFVAVFISSPKDTTGVQVGMGTFIPPFIAKRI